MNRVLENALVELLVDLPADADVPIVASALERTWLWSDLHRPCSSLPAGAGNRGGCRRGLVHGAALDAPCPSHSGGAVWSDRSLRPSVGPT